MDESEILGNTAVIWRLKQHSGQRFCIFQRCGDFRSSSYARGCGSLSFETEHNKYHLVCFLDLVQTSSHMDGKTAEVIWSLNSTVRSLLHPCRVSYPASAWPPSVTRILLILEKTHPVLGSLGTLERSSRSLSWSLPLCGIPPLILALHPRNIWRMSLLPGGLLATCEPWSYRPPPNLCWINILWFFSEPLYDLVWSLLSIPDPYRKVLKVWCADIRQTKLTSTSYNC